MEEFIMKKLLKFFTVLGASTVILAEIFNYGLNEASVKADRLSTKFYPLAALVTEVDGELITVTCQNGNEFQFDNDGREDWFVSDICSMIMSDNGTIEVYDDEIVNVRYSGYVCDNEIDKWVK